MATHVYFDFFGTLVDYDASVHPAAANAPHEFALRHGSAIDAHRASGLWQTAWSALDSTAEHTGRECSLHEIADRYRELAEIPPVADQDLDTFVAAYLDAWTANIRLAPSAVSCVDDLAADHTLSIVSNTHHAPLVPELLERFGIAGYFTDVFTSIEIGWRKPRSEIFETALSRHTVTGAEAVFVGDNWVADIEGPRALGMIPFYVGPATPNRTPVTLAELPALIRATAA
ncbi:putative hydrolase of the HAD superfamily [Leucobacter luti]|uniref:HAD family hydrolase n=1 Tax=Leucobacter luti TaxID=340320 RepID=UPI00104A6550|nr:HAD family hydrolase [Leucobacter luti]MCW2288003.1 putative hydrolase of the HAD superfamily [Leucobacter luti]TCK45835.1 putative hydrolase of the HAD superfamily [Leucobacter luti]